MFTLAKKYKREFVYSSYIFLTFELLLTPAFIFNMLMYYTTVAIGLLIIASWLIHTYNLKGTKKISKHSDILMRINLKERLFTHVFLPFIFFISISLYLFFNTNAYMNQLVVVICSILFFYLFLHIRSSYDKAFYIKRDTKIVYDLITITAFFLTTSVIVNFGLPFAIVGWLIFLLSFIALIYMLYINNKFGLTGVLVAVFCSILVSSTGYLVWGLNIFIVPAIVSTAFYTIVALWHVRFSGSRGFEDYIPPLMYTLMILILILSL